MGASGKSSAVLPQSQALSILNKCSPTITQFGCSAQAWQVSSVRQTREMQLKADGLCCLGIANDRGLEDGSMRAHMTLVLYKKRERESYYSRTVSRRARTNIDTRVLLLRSKSPPFLFRVQTIATFDLYELSSENNSVEGWCRWEIWRQLNFQGPTFDPAVSAEPQV